MPSGPQPLGFLLLGPFETLCKLNDSSYNEVSLRMDRSRFRCRLKVSDYPPSVGDGCRNNFATSNLNATSNNSCSNHLSGNL
ncbi:hypothetical protein TNCV_3673191 [Trichonephila clavipes]|nr:hypothetical protein TNCV_3673191 [Trichonephila clavipes]